MTSSGIKVPVFRAGIRLGALAAVAGLLLTAAAPAPARSDDPCKVQATGKSYIKSSPASGPYRLYVMGDSLGDGVWSGLTRRFKGDDTVQVFRKTKVNSGIVRNDRFDWNRAMLQLAREPMHIAVMMFGANDLQSIRAPGKRYHFNTEEWRTHFEDRIDRLIEPLKRANVAIYWIGLPVVGRAEFAGGYKILNEIFQQKMAEHGVKFIDVWSSFASNAGTFVMHGPDVRGKLTVLRHTDRVHFTVSGNEKLASFVEAEIREDLAQLTACLKKAEKSE